MAKATQNSPEASGVLGIGVLVAYAIYALPLTATTIAITSFIPGYYSATLGLSLATIGSAMLAIRLTDAIVDPLIGWMVDAAPFKQRYKPWTLIILPLYLLAVFLVFFPIVESPSPLYLFAAGAIAYISFSVASVVHQAWGAALAHSPTALTRLFGYREIAVILGIFGLFGATAIAESLTGDAVQLRAMAAGGFLIIVLTLATLATLIFTPDPPAEGRAGAHFSLHLLKPFLLSGPFMRICGATFCINFAWMANGAIGFFIAKYLFGAADRFALGLTVTFVCAAIGMAIWLPLAKRIGDRRAMTIACLYLAAIFGAQPLAFGFGVPGYLAAMALMGLGFGAGPFMLRSLTGAAANAYERQEAGSVRGAAYAAAIFFDKMGSGAGAASLILVAALGFDPKTVVTASGVQGLTIIAVGVPVLGFLLCAWLTHSIRIDDADTATGDGPVTDAPTGAPATDYAAQSAA